MGKIGWERTVQQEREGKRGGKRGGEKGMGRVRKGRGGLERVEKERTGKVDAWEWKRGMGEKEKERGRERKYCKTAEKLQFLKPNFQLWRAPVPIMSP